MDNPGQNGQCQIYLVLCLATTQRDALGEPLGHAAHQLGEVVLGHCFGFHFDRCLELIESCTPPRVQLGLQVASEVLDGVKIRAVRGPWLQDADAGGMLLVPGIHLG